MILAGKEFDSLVRSAISASQPELATLFMARLRPHSMARIGIEAAFSSPSAPVRVIRLANILTDLAYGSDPEFALGLGEAMLKIWPHEIDLLNFQSQQVTNATLLAVIRSTAQSNLLVGNFDKCVELIDGWLRPEQFRVYKELYASTYLRKVEALAHQLKLSEAITAFRELTEEELQSTQDSKVVWAYIEPFVADILQPDRVFNYRQRVREIIDGPLPQTQQTVALWAETWKSPHLPAASRDWAVAKIESLQSELTRLSSISADPTLPDADRVDQLMRGLNWFSRTARELLLSGAPPILLDLHGVNELNNYAAMIQGLVHPTPQELEQALGAAAEAEVWCRRTDCKRGLLDSLQAQRALHSRASDNLKAREASLRLYRELRLLREQSRMFEVQAAVARVYRGLTYNICQKAVEFSAPAEAFSATEFRRGLSIAQPRQPPGWKGPDPLVTPLRAKLLGSNTHYLGLTAFDESDPIGATLYCADGNIVFRWLSLTPAELRNAASNLNPRDWNDKPPIFGKAKQDPRGTFAPLLEPVREAIASSQILEGDHICIAADDPVHAAPVQYLPLAEGLAVHFLSFSRVASFADAKIIFESSVKRPSRAIAAFIPALPEWDLDAKQQAFAKVCSRLISAGMDLSVLEAVDLDREALLAKIEKDSLVYIHSHGSFNPRRDPMDHAGILISDTKQPAIRGGDNPSLLTPRAVLHKEEMLHRSVIALSACVSGLGRRGIAGDTIGLEFALRVKEAASVIASHWDLSWRSASSFFESFFELWLVRGQSRASAWRSAILDQADTVVSGKDDKALLNACAFSLFGDWR